MKEIIEEREEKMKDIEKFEGIVLTLISSHRYELNLVHGQAS